MAHTDPNTSLPRFAQQFAHPVNAADWAARRAAMAAALDACRAERASTGDAFLDWDGLEEEIAQRRCGLGGRGQ